MSVDAWLASRYIAWRIANRKQVTGVRPWAQLAPYAQLLTGFLVVNVVPFALPMAHRM